MIDEYIQLYLMGQITRDEVFDLVDYGYDPVEIEEELEEYE